MEHLGADRSARRGDGADRIAKAHLVERDPLAGSVGGQRQRVSRLGDTRLHVEQLEDAIEQRQPAEQRGVGAGERRGGLVELAQVGGEGHHRTQRDLLGNDQVGAEGVQEGRSERRQALHQHRQPLAGEDLLDLGLAHHRVHPIEAGGLARLHAEALDHDRARQAERLLEHDRQLGQCRLDALHGFVATTSEVQHRQREGRQCHERRERQPPVHEQHDDQDADDREQVCERSQKGLGEHVLEATGVVDEAGLDLAGARPGEEIETQGLEVAVQPGAQIRDDTLRDARAQQRLAEAEDGAAERQQEDPEAQQQRQL